jgi:hypothetical protein
MPQVYTIPIWLLDQPQTASGQTRAFGIGPAPAAFGSVVAVLHLVHEAFIGVSFRLQQRVPMLYIVSAGSWSRGLFSWLPRCDIVLYVSTFRVGKILSFCFEQTCHIEFFAWGAVC